MYIGGTYETKNYIYLYIIPAYHRWQQLILSYHTYLVPVEKDENGQVTAALLSRDFLNNLLFKELEYPVDLTCDQVAQVETLISAYPGADEYLDKKELKKLNYLRRYSGYMNNQKELCVMVYL